MDPEAGHYNAESGYILENGEEYYAGECESDEVGIKAVDESDNRIVYLQESAV